MKKIAYIALSIAIFMAGSNLYAYTSPASAGKEITSSQRSLLEAKASIRTEATGKLKQWKERLKEHYGEGEKNDLEVTMTASLIWDYILMVNNLKRVDAGSLKERSKLYGSKDIISILAQSNNGLAENRSLYFNYFDRVLEDLDAYTEKVISVHIKRQAGRDNSEKALSFFTLSLNIDENSEKLIEKIYREIAGLKARDSINEALMELSSSEILGDGKRKGGIRADQLEPFLILKHQLLYAYLSMRLAMLKYKARINVSYADISSKKERLAYKAIRRSYIEKTVLKQKNIRLLDKSESDYYNSIQGSLRTALDTFEDQKQLLSSLNETILTDFKRILLANDLIRFEAENPGNDSSKDFKNRFYALDSEAMLYHRKLVMDKISSGKLNFGNYMDITKDYPEISSFADTLFAGIDTDRALTHKEKQRKDSFETALKVYEHYAKIQDLDDRKALNYLEQLKVANEVISYEKKRIPTDNLKKKFNYAGQLLYNLIRRKNLDDAVDKTLKAFESDSSKLRVNPHNRDITPSDISRALKDSRSSRARTGAFDRIDGKTEPFHKNSDELTYDLSFMPEGQHSFFTCDRVTCPHLIHYDDYRDMIALNTYMPGTGSAYPMHWLVTRLEIDELLFPFDDTQKESHWLNRHKLDDSERKVLADVNDEIMDILKVGYDSFKELIYGGDIEKQKRITETLFKNLDNNPLMKSSASDLRTVHHDDSLSDIVYDGFANFSSSFIRGFKKTKELAKKTGKEKVDILTVSTVPSKNEVFSMYGNPYRRYDSSTSLNYPKILDNFTEVEKKILFENYMMLFMVQDDPQANEFFVKTGNFLNYINSSFTSLLDRKLIGPNDYIRLSSMFVPYNPINEVVGRDKFDALMFFYFDKMTDKQRFDSNVYAVRKMRSDHILSRLKQSYGYGSSELEQGLSIIQVTTTPEFQQDFLQTFGINFIEAKSEITENEQGLLDSSLFKDWFRKQYGEDFDFWIYYRVRNEWIPTKMEFVTKLFIEYLISEKAKLYDENFDLLEYVEARTHLRILTSILLVRMAFMFLHEPYEFESIILSSMVPNDCLDFAFHWFNLLVIWQIQYVYLLRPALAAIGRHITRPALSWFLNRTVPQLIKKGPLKGLRNIPIRAVQGLLKTGNRLSSYAFSPGNTLKRGILEGENETAKRLFLRWVRRENAGFNPESEIFEGKRGFFERLQTAWRASKDDIGRAKFQGNSYGLWEKIDLFMNKFKDYRYYFVEELKPFSVGPRSFQTYSIHWKYLKNNYSLRNIGGTGAKRISKKMAKHNMPNEASHDAFEAIGAKDLADFLEKHGIKDLYELYERRLQTLAMTDLAILKQLRYVYIDQRGFTSFIRTKEQMGGRIIDMELIPFVEGQSAGSISYNYVNHVKNSDLFLLDLTSAENLKGVERVIATYLQSQGRTYSRTTFSEALNEYLLKKANIQVDGIIYHEGEQMVIKVVSDNFARSIIRSLNVKQPLSIAAPELF